MTQKRFASLGLESEITFGKYSGRKVEAIYKEDSGYLVWLREERRTKNAQTNFFNQEVNTLLDMTIAESKPLRKKYQTWSSLGLLNEDDTRPSGVVVPKPEVVPEREVAYGGWGAY